ncbi:MarR family winged helix-turn-helix transcriptional regulator [Mesorhizobium sp. INR15]|uniref:MarR family winged helix-turn-helix transcriptional regulator n=1 Tax=Mesorhizobium sp. INR15 TaxID=2654248 RepID=UPI001896790A|nr:MarR family winged helix-turn-helix transcriptional regulator [Mesorhizobium sp. INR15]QPC94690.1 MarR family transcriptional regulator [Mesorhizobium sp. INR15]
MNGFDPERLKLVAADCPGFQARATARAVTRHYNTFFKPLGLTAEQFSLLVGVGSTRSATVAGLAVSAGVDATTLSRNVQNLERRDLVRAEGGRGRWGKQLGLTEAGRRLMAEALPRWELARAELSRRLGKEALQSARRAMLELAEAASYQPDGAGIDRGPSK